MEAANGFCFAPWRRSGASVASRVSDRKILRWQMSLCSRPFPDKTKRHAGGEEICYFDVTTGSRVQIPPCSRKRVRSSAW
jgi:hypothetical protein